MTTRKKTATRRKVAKKTETTPKKAGRKATAAKGEPPESRRTAIEERLLAPLEEIESLLTRLRRMQPIEWEWPRLNDLPASFETRFPSMDIVDRDSEIVIKAEVPGIDKDDIDISLSGRTLTIQGETRHEEEKEEGNVHQREIRTGSFVRVATLPEEVDGGKARSAYKDGVLTLRLPKLRKAKKHRIKVT